MDPAHLISPPRAHPSGTGNGEIDMDEHHQRHQQNIIHETWFIIITVIILLLFSSMAGIAMVFFRRKHQIKKEIGHLSGKRMLLVFSY